MKSKFEDLKTNKHAVIFNPVIFKSELKNTDFAFASVEKNNFRNK